MANYSKKSFFGNEIVLSTTLRRLLVSKMKGESLVLVAELNTLSKLKRFDFSEA